MNSGVPARSQSSNSAASTLVSVAPARSRRCRPDLAVGAWREPTASAATCTATPRSSRSSTVWRDADVGLDAADERLVAPAEVEAVGAHGGEDRLLDGAPRRRAARPRPTVCSRPLRVLLGDEDRDAEDRARPRRAGRTARATSSKRAVGAEGLLDVDDDERGAVASSSAALVAGAHAGARDRERRSR